MYLVVSVHTAGQFSFRHVSPLMQTRVQLYYAPAQLGKHSVVSQCKQRYSLCNEVVPLLAFTTYSMCSVSGSACMIVQKNTFASYHVW